MNPETHWKGPNGVAYTTRQALEMQSRRVMFADIYDSMTIKPASVIEFGANIGDNLRAIRHIFGGNLTGVEINEALLEPLKQAADHAFIGAIQSFNPPRKYDLAFTRGLLIHIPPEDLPSAYDTLYQSSNRYILVAEYYNPKPVEVEYRGEKGLLWKRDFAGEIMDRYKDLTLIDYGFVYHRDTFAPQDDVTWMLLQKKQ